MENFKVGDLVMAFVYVVRREDMRKMTKFWRGPFTITRILNGGWAYTLSNGYKVNYENIKKYLGRPHQFAVDENEEVLIFPSLEDIEEVMLPEPKIEPDLEGSECSVMNKGIRPDTEFHMGLRDRNKVRRRFDPDFIQDYYSIVSGTSETKAMCLQFDSAMNTHVLIDSDTASELESLNSTLCSASWPWQCKADDALPAVNEHDSFDEEILSRDRCNAAKNSMNQSENSKSNVQATNLENHFSLSHCTQYIQLEAYVNNSFSVNFLNTDLNSLNSLISCLTSRVLLPTTNVSSTSSHSVSLINTKPRISQPSLVPLPSIFPFDVTPENELSQTHLACIPNRLMKDILSVEFPIVLLMSLDLQPSSIFQKEVLTSLSDKQIQSIFQQRKLAGEFACIENPMHLDTSMIVLLFVSSRSLNPISPEAFGNALTAFRFHKTEQDITQLAFLRHDFEQRNLMLEEFFTITKRAFPAAECKVFNSFKCR